MPSEQPACPGSQRRPPLSAHPFPLVAQVTQGICAPSSPLSYRWRSADVANARRAFSRHHEHPPAPALEGHGCSRALHALVGRRAQQAEAIVGVAVAGDPRGIEGFRQQNYDVQEFDLVNLDRLSCSPPTSCFLPRFASSRNYRLLSSGSCSSPAALAYRVAIASSSRTAPFSRGNGS